MTIKNYEYLGESISTLDIASYTECKGEPARRVNVCQKEGEAIKVELGTKGIGQNIYNERLILESIEEKVLSYTVPIGKKFDLTNIACSGDNIARFRIEIAGDVKQKKRSWWTNFNVDFNFNELIIEAGEKIEVFAENIGTGTADFNATIIGGVYDE